MKKVNWGIIGFGNAANSFINAIKYIPNVNLYGISSLSNYKNLLLNSILYFCPNNSIQLSKIFHFKYFFNCIINP